MSSDFQINFDEFTRDLKRETGKELEDTLVDFQKKISLEVLTGVVEKTPVDTGRARAGWIASIGKPSIVKTKRKDKSGNSTIDKGGAKIDKLKPFQTLWISNNVEYIEFLEHGSSQQSPRGMAALTIAEVNARNRTAV